MKRIIVIIVGIVIVVGAFLFFTGGISFSKEEDKWHSCNKENFDRDSTSYIEVSMTQNEPRLYFVQFYHHVYKTVRGWTLTDNQVQSYFDSWLNYGFIQTDQYDCGLEQFNVLEVS